MRLTAPALRNEEAPTVVEVCGARLAPTGRPRNGAVGAVWPTRREALGRSEQGGSPIHEGRSVLSRTKPVRVSEIDWSAALAGPASPGPRRRSAPGPRQAPQRRPKTFPT